MIGGYNPWFIEEAVRRIKEKSAELCLSMGSGAAPDYASYRQGCGVIQGLDEAIEIIERIKKEVDQS